MSLQAHIWNSLPGNIKQKFSLQNHYINSNTLLKSGRVLHPNGNCVVNSNSKYAAMLEFYYNDFRGVIVRQQTLNPKFLCNTFQGSHYFFEGVVLLWFVMTGGVTTLGESVFTFTQMMFSKTLFLVFYLCLTNVHDSLVDSLNH